MEGVIAQILLFAGTFAPKNWAYCNGQIIPIAQNTALFSLLGTTYGGDGRVNFALPNLQGRVAIGAGNGPGLSPYALGQAAGSESVTILPNQIPGHVHPATATVAVSVTNTPAGTEDPVGGLLTETAAPFYASSGASTGNLGGVSATVTVGPNQGGQPVNIMPPYLALNYVICLYGIFPSRN
jgi:microcystin-dependent protein